MVSHQRLPALSPEAGQRSTPARWRWCAGLALWLMLAPPCPANDAVTMYIMSGRPKQQFQENLERQAKLHVITAREACGLNPEQASKLEQAALGDVTRAMQDLVVLRRATEGFNLSNGPEMQKAFEMLQPFMMRMRSGLHGEGSLFSRYLQHTLDEAQRKRYQEYLAEKERQRHHLITLNTVAAIDERVPLMKAQREQLVELIDKQPIPKLGLNTDMVSAYVRLADVPEGELTRFLDAEQSKFIIKICEPYRAFRGVVP
jgi:hypothetical protein